MTVLMVSEPGVDGVFRYVEALTYFLLENDVRVHLAYSSCRGSDCLVELTKAVEKAGGATMDLRVSNRPCAYDIVALARLERFIQRTQPDIIHSHSAKAGVLARSLYPLHRNIRFFYHPHAYLGMRPNRGRIDAVYDTIERLLGRVGKTLNCSRQEYNYARDQLRIPETKLIHAPNSVDFDHFHPPTPERKIEARREFGIPTNALVLGSLGRTAEQKNPLLLYRAFALFAKEREDVHLLHIGRGPLDKELDAFISANSLNSKVTRIPYLTNSLAFYHAIDGFCLTSRYEGLSMAVLEALACNLPLILSKAAASRELEDFGLNHTWICHSNSEKKLGYILAIWSKSRTEDINHRIKAEPRFNQRECLRRLSKIFSKGQSLESADQRKCNQLSEAHHKLS